ncbi:DUF4349 domain-containing protein [Candidatus Woesearchaeota archaeon]|nr:DUF4349 domain-containing protein [Candidatus Woesearchaeota archaeon]
MTIKNQLLKLKENWLLLALVIAVLLIFSGITSNLSSITNDYGYEKQAAMSSSRGMMSFDGIIPPVYQEDFAPEIKERAITKSSSLSTEIERSKFQESSERIKSLIKKNNAILLNENVNEYESGRNSYLTGYYQIKIETSKYDYLLNELKNIGELKSFNENADDITKTANV